MYIELDSLQSMICMYETQHLNCETCDNNCANAECRASAECNSCLMLVMYTTVCSTEQDGYFFVDAEI
jgi:hypothetical protein